MRVPGGGCACCATARAYLATSDTTASWDARLAAAMQRHGLSVAEEALASSLLEDLRCG